MSSQVVSGADMATAAALGDSTVFPVTSGPEIAGTTVTLGAGDARGWLGERGVVGWVGACAGKSRRNKELLW